MLDNWPIDLRELRYFVTVAELKSFTKAATIMHIAQPALSRQVLKLERQLGVELFTRHARGVELTEPGGLLLQRTYSIFRQLKATRDDVVAHAESPCGVIALGTPPAAGEFLAPSLAARTRSTYPKITLKIVEGFSGFIHERLTNHLLDLAILHNPTPHRDLQIEPLLVEQMYLIGAADKAMKVCPLPELGQLPLILPGRPHSLRLLLEKAAAEQNMKLTIAFEVDGLGILKKMVEHNLGYTVLTFGSVYNEVANGTLSATPIGGPDVSWTLSMATRVDQSRSRTMIVIQKLVREVVRDLVDRGVWRGDPHYESAVPIAPLPEAPGVSVS